MGVGAEVAGAESAPAVKKTAKAKHSGSHPQAGSMSTMFDPAAAFSADDAVAVSDADSQDVEDKSGISSTPGSSLADGPCRL